MCTLEFEPINISNALNQLGTSSTGHNNLSLIKELFDNSISAGATIINVTKRIVRIPSGKTTYEIHYNDNGDGMTKIEILKCVQLNSENIKGGIGKYGIGGVSTLVNWSDIEDTDYDKNMTIITKTSDGNTRSLVINWSKCKTIKDYQFQVENSYKENDKSAIDFLKSKDINKGTYIIIQTSEKKYSEITEIGVDVDNYIDIGTTYQFYFENGLTITLFDDQINYFAIPESVLSDSILIEIFKKGKGEKEETVFSAKVGRKTISRCYTNKREKEKKGWKCPDLENDPNFKFVCNLTLKLEMPIGIYTPKPDDVNRTTCGDDFNVNTWEDWNYFCEQNDLTDNSSLAKEYIEHLYVIREDNLEKCRGLGTLDLGIGLGGARGFTGFGDPFYVKKELIFKTIDDTKLKLVQQNKSVIEWTNTPRGLKPFIKKILTDWCKYKLGPKLKDLDTEALKRQNADKNMLEIKNIIMKCEEEKINYMARMETNKFVPTYINKQSPISAGHVIYRAFKSLMKKRREQRELATIYIQRWFRNQNKTGGPTEGFIKFQRFIKWSHLHYNASKIQKWFKNILLKKAIINYLLCDICKRIVARKSVYVIEKAWQSYKVRKNSSDNENKAAIVLQKYIRRYLATCAVKREKDKNNEYKFLTNNLMSDINIPELRTMEDFNKFKYDIINKLNELSKLL